MTIRSSRSCRLSPTIPDAHERALDAFSRSIGIAFQIRDDIIEWLRLSAEREDDWVPDRFELSFGITDQGRRSADSSSVSEPVQVTERLLLRGSIDLVERRPGGALRVTDHKTGKARANPDVVVGGGEVLQPLLYALACERLLGEKVESGRLYYCTADGEYQERSVLLNAATRAQIEAAVGVIDTALESGFLPAAPTSDACRQCDYRVVCGPWEEFRTQRKPASALSRLTQLRRMA